jgi:hypothetical protein
MDATIVEKRGVKRVQICVRKQAENSGDCATIECAALPYDREDRRIISYRSQISTTVQHIFYIRARRKRTESSTVRWLMTFKVRLKIHSPMHSKVDGLLASPSKLDAKQSSLIRVKSSVLSLASCPATLVAPGGRCCAKNPARDLAVLVVLEDRGCLRLFQTEARREGRVGLT